MNKFFRRVAAPLSCIAALAAVIAPTVAPAQSGYFRSAAEPKFTAIVMDARTGEILYNERADSVRYPASVTKVMTLYLTFEALASGRLHLNDTITVSPLAAAQPATKLGLRAGETITVEEAMNAMAVHSANDMAVAMSERIGGTEARFADMMTLKAQQLGMANTRYVNANGLPDSRQVTTAHDLAILTRAVLRDYPQYYHFFSQQQFTYRGHLYANTNHLLGKMPGVDGLKTGFTNAAGFNLAASAMRNGHRLIAVVMGGTSGSMRNANVEGMLLTGFDVMERRDRGERIASTQAMFGQPSTLYTSGRFSARDDEDPIDVVLARNTSAQPGPIAVSSAQGPARAAPVGGWWVQVGEFRSRAAAKSQIESMSHRFARLFDAAEGSVETAGRTFKARFSGLSEMAAKDACSTIKGRGMPCVAGV
jgi:D-alanyl-D-alanine carboxypeptidase (penicillin-binding protein 5/6)